MELQEVERRCCVVKVSSASSGRKKSASCSGVIVHPQTGTLLCSSLPFLRFIADKERSSSAGESCFLPPRSLTDQLRIRVSFSPQREVDTGQQTLTPSRSEATGQKKVPARLLMLVNCLEFSRAFRAVFQDADRWRFHDDEEAEAEDVDEDLELIGDAHFLSWFAVLQTDEVSPSSAGSVPWQSSSSLLKGGPVLACASPFGSVCEDLFFSSLTRGIVSNLAGEDNAVILTDARCLPGTEGGGLFSVNGADGVRLIGLIVCPFGWKANEWIGLALACSVHLIIKSIIRCTSTEDPLRDAWLQPAEAGLRMSTTAHELKARRYPTVCFVESGGFWGSGVVVSPSLVLTCRHVVNGNSQVNVKFHHRDRVHKVVGVVLFSTKASSPYDLALVELKKSVPETLVPQMAQGFNPGESVVVVGYGGLGQCCGPSLTGGVLSKAISWKSKPVMLQTTCAVQTGASGGAVVRKHTGELLGIVSSNTRDLAAKVTYPHLNFCIPATVFHKPVQRFQQTQNVNVFSTLDTKDKGLTRVWRLYRAQSKI